MDTLAIVSSRTPTWLKEAGIIVLGVFGGLALFQATKKHLPTKITG